MKPNLRCCVSCRRIADKKEFWRIVRVYPSHQVQLDQGEGRSAYLCPLLSCLKAAQKKNRLGRTLKANVPSEIYQSLSQRLSAKQEPDLQGSASPPPVLSK
ncbi:MAG TPA: YlxR family protein [Halomicronema sp.]